MTLRKQAQLIATLVLVGQLVCLALIAGPLAHAASNYSMDDPLRTLFFFAGLSSFVFVGAAYIAFEKLVYRRLQLLGEDSWLQTDRPTTKLVE